MRALAALLASEGYATHAVTWKKGRVSNHLAEESEKIVSLLSLPSDGDCVLVGRSFGARASARAASKVHPRFCIFLGYPIRPPGQRREEDEHILRTLAFPTLIIQGANDEKGPLRLMKKLASENSNIELHVIPGARHAFNKGQWQAAISKVQGWIRERNQQALPIS